MSQDTAAVDYALHTAKEHDVRFIRLWFTDILGNLKEVAITRDELEDVLARGAAFDGSSIEGFARADEADMIIKPDATTFRILPWRTRESTVARLFCNVLTAAGQPFEGDPRYVLKRNLEQAARLGYTFYVGPELEFFYFRSAHAAEPLDHGDYFDQTPADLADDLRRETVLTLVDTGIPVKYSHHEGAPGQHEIDLQYTDALTMADNVMAARLTIKEVAQRHGAYATFMPKPAPGINGSGMHVNLSLFQGDRNAFYDPDDELKLSELARGFIAGLLRHAPEVTLVTNQWVNSYKRLVPGYEAPVHITWATINHSDLIRVPAYKPGREESVRVEYRAPDPACNPYLAFAALLAAGLEGIAKGYPLPPPVEEDLQRESEKQLQARDIHRLPGSLLEAIQQAERSDLVRRALGDHTFHSLIRNKTIEWEHYRTQVTDYETKRYLPVL
ncbi:MAG: glutamine synthetase [Chloroflexi bacterium]|nr:glutamine synthetase [Chloroflexota bacterium]